MGQAGQTRVNGAVETPLAGLTEILAGCARGEKGAAEGLRHWEGGRIQQMLARTQGEPRHVQAALSRLIADLASEIGAFPGGGEAAAQDWLFARMRLTARGSGGEDRSGRKLYAVTPRPHSTEPPPVRQAAPALTQANPSPAHQGHDAGDRVPVLTNARLRPPGAPVRASRSATPLAQVRPKRTGSRLRASLLLLLGVTLIGLAMAAAVNLLHADWPVKLAGPREAVAPAAPPMPVPSPPPPAPPRVRQQLGPPIAAREPPLVAGPVARPAPVPPPAPAAVAPLRVVVHHGSSQESRAVAEQLASQLQSAGFGEVEVTAVRFDVAAASIRYFHAEDRAGAGRLVAAIGPFLSWHGRAAPSTPISFTDYRPLPRRGTLEIWLPRR